MNRRDFIKKTSVAAALTTWTVTCQYEEPEPEQDPKGEEGEVGETGQNWSYRVYCYEREQGEWLFSSNIRGSFAPQREYMTFKEEDCFKYCGWMNQGKLHFNEFDDAVTFVDCHVRTKNDTDLIDSIYDIYFVNREGTEIKVAHYWFNGDTGRTITWEQDGFNRATGRELMHWSKIESV